MKQPLDHLKSLKKPVRKVVWVNGDSELADELTELEASLSAQENVLRAIPEGSPRWQAASDKVADLRAQVEAKRQQVKETSIKFVFQSLGRKRYEDLLEQHQPTEEQVQKYKDNEQGERLEFNPDTFPVALISACMVEPELDQEDVEQWLNSDDWNTVEVLTLFMTAMEVNQSRKIIDMGKG